MSSAPASSTAPVWFITGCSTGFGRELALAVLDKGWRAVVTARQPGALAEFGERYGDRALVLELDVTQASQINRAHVCIFAADVVFLDPPYRLRHSYEEALTSLADSSLVWAMSLVIAEHEKKFDPGSEFGSLRRIRTLTQGNSSLSFYRIGGQPDLNK